MWYHTVVLGSALLIPSSLCARMAARDHRAVDQSHPARTTIIPANRTINHIIYQFPKDGDVYVQPGTTIIVRLSKAVHDNSPSDFSFTVKGEQSGQHLGKIVIPGDNNTVIFKPDNPFTLTEKVDVQLTIACLDPIISFSYGFQITSMDQKEQASWLKYFSDKEEKENLTFRAQTFQTNQKRTYIPLDSIPVYFPEIIVDVNFPGSAPGNIFLTPVGESGPEKSFAFNTIVDNTGTFPVPSQSSWSGKSCGRFQSPANEYNYFSDSYYRRLL